MMTTETTEQTTLGALPAAPSVNGNGAHVAEIVAATVQAMTAKQDAAAEKRAEKRAAEMAAKEAQRAAEKAATLAEREAAAEKRAQERAAEKAAKQAEREAAAAAKAAARAANPNPTSTDYMTALNDLGYSFRLNEVDDTTEVNGRRMDDGTAATIRAAMRDRGFTQVPAFEDAYTAYAYANPYHPVKQYLEGLTWNGKSNIGALGAFVTDAHDPIGYSGGTSAPVFNVWLGRWLIGAVAKVYEGGRGGLRAQNPTLVLDGKQDLGKSSLVHWLASPLPEYFTEEAIRPDDPESARWLASKWIWEVPELGATTRRQDREALKAFLTRQECAFRVPYARHPVLKPAMASFIGTINNEAGFLQDPTGNRRFLTVKLTRIDFRYQDSIDVNQVWAEAFARYRDAQGKGKPWELTAAEKKVRDRLNEGFEVEDHYAARIQSLFVVIRDTEQAAKVFTPTTDIVDALKAAGLREANDKTMSMNVATACRRMGLEATRKRVKGAPVPVRGYCGLALRDAKTPAEYDE